MGRKYPNFDEIDCVQYFKSPRIPENLLDFDNFLSGTKKFLKASEIKIHDKIVKIPRKQAGFGGFTYYYNELIEPEKNELTATMKNLIEWFKENLNSPMELKTNFCFVNWYEDDTQYIGYHSDKEAMLDTTQPIISLSIYDDPKNSWPFRMRCKETGKTYEQCLGHGDMIVMFGDCQKKYKHSVPKLKSNKGQRINMTFRTILENYK